MNSFMHWQIRLRRAAGAEQGHEIGRHQVRTLIKLAGLQPIQPKSFVPRTTDSTHGKAYWPNLLLDQPLAQEPNLIWVMENPLVIIPLRNALQARQPSAGLITHSDRGGQYVSNDLHELINLWHIRPSMSRPDDPYDNAFAESFWIRPPKRPPESGIIGGRYVLECGRCRTEVFEYIEMYYNRVRKHCAGSPVVAGLQKP